MREHHLPVTRTARYITLGPLDQPVTQVWFACHGYGQRASELAEWLGVLDDGSRLIVVPEGLSRFYRRGTGGTGIGASWMTREEREHEIADYLGYLDALAERVLADARRTPGCTVHVLGFSQGVATVARWAVAGRQPPAQLILWGSDVPPDLDFEAARKRLAETRVVLVAGSRDQYVDDAFLARQTAVLDRHEIRHDVVRFDGGHRLDDEVLLTLAGQTT